MNGTRREAGLAGEVADSAGALRVGIGEHFQKNWPGEVADARGIHDAAEVIGQERARGPLRLRTVGNAAQDDAEHVQDDWPDEPVGAIDGCRLDEDAAQPLGREPYPALGRGEEVGGGAVLECGDVEPICALLKRGDAERLEEFVVFEAQGEEQGEAVGRGGGERREEAADALDAGVAFVLEDDEFLELIEDGDEPRGGVLFPKLREGALDQFARSGAAARRRTVSSRAPGSMSCRRRSARGSSCCARARPHSSPRATAG